MNQWIRLLTHSAASRSMIKRLAGRPKPGQKTGDVLAGEPEGHRPEHPALEQQTLVGALHVGGDHLDDELVHQGMDVQHLRQCTLSSVSIGPDLTNTARLPLSTISSSTKASDW